MIQWRGYAMAAGSVVGSATITAVLWPWLAPSPSMLFVPAVLLSALYGGLGPGLVATGGSAVVLAFFFLPPYFSFAVSGVSDLVRLAIFALTTVVVSSLTADRRRAQEETRVLGTIAEQRRHEVERLYRDLEAALRREHEAEDTRRSERFKAALRHALMNDLRTPLTAMKAAATALRQGVMHGDAEAEREMLDVITEEIDRLDRLADGLSDPNRQPLTAGGGHAETVHDLLRAPFR